MRRIYSKALDLEDDILQRFGLPESLKYRLVFIELFDEKEIDKTISHLTLAATEFLNSTPANKIELLEDAKRNDLKLTRYIQT